jgi:hypothetical protein
MKNRKSTFIRVSTLATYPDCERRGAARLFRREIDAAGFKLRQTPYGIGAAVGTAVHKGVAVELGEAATAGRLPPVSVPLDAAVESLTEQLALGEVAFDGKRGPTQNRGQAVHQAASMVRTYHANVAPKLKPITVEHRLEAEISPGFVLSGQSDQVCREPQSIRDLKTGTRSPASVSAQIGGYSLLNRSHNMTIDTASMDWIKRVSERVEQPPPVSQTVKLLHAETAASMVLAHIMLGIKTFRQGDPERGILPGDPWAFLANPSSILCSAKWCPAHGTEFCHEWSEKEQ